MRSAAGPQNRAVRVLVTGGAGYVGSVTAEALLRAGHDVLVFDDLSGGHRAAVPERAAFVQGDLREPSAIRAAVERFRPEGVCHFAGHLQVGESMTDPLKYLGENVQMGIHLLRAMLDGGVRRFVLSSTANLFAGAEGRLDESSASVPASPYGESKLYLERALHWLQRSHGLASASLRYFNAAGATAERGEDHDPETHLIPLVLQVALGRRERVQVFGTDYPTPDGSCIRDYVHVSDLAAAHVLALESSQAGCRAYNLGSGRGCSVREVVEAARKITGRPIPVAEAPRRPGDVARLVADSSLARRELGWEPRHSDLDRILESAWAWRRGRPDGYGRGR